MATEAVAQSPFFEIPIPELRSSMGWKEVPVKENGETLTLLNGFDPNRIAVDSQYFKQNIPHATLEMYARNDVAKRLQAAANLLPVGFKLLVWDAFRPLEVQQSLFDDYKNRLHSEHPDWDDDKLVTETQTYVSLPSTNATRPSPHNTGGAIDLTICGQDGNPIPMGVPFDHFGPESKTDYFECLDRDLTQDEKIARDNRRLLYHVMTQAGFSAYDEEWWHFDYGNQFDAKRTNKSEAIYGRTELGGDNNGR